MGCKLCCEEEVVKRNMPNLMKLKKNHLLTICTQHKIAYKRSDTKEQLKVKILEHFKGDLPDSIMTLEVLNLGPVSPQLRKQVWRTYIGEDVKRAKCGICDEDIVRDSAGWHASHVIASSNGGETVLENLRPLCATCNTSMGNEEMRTYMRQRHVDPLKFDALRL